MKIPDILMALQPVIEAFEKLSIPYYIGGSIASSIYGMARATMDVDIVADINSNHISLLRQKLEKDYYIDEETIADAIGKRSSFNLIHLKSMIKIDVFIHKNEPYQNEALRRKIEENLDESEPSSKYYFSSPEDIVINKLQWYEIGGRVSERQWLDIIGVIKVQCDSLNKKYLQDWSNKLGLYDLLEKAFSDADVKLKQ